MLKWSLVQFDNSAQNRMLLLDHIKSLVDNRKRSMVLDGNLAGQSFVISGLPSDSQVDCYNSSDHSNLHVSNCAGPIQLKMTNEESFY